MAKKDKRLQNIKIEYGDETLFSDKDVKCLVNAIAENINCVPQWSRDKSSKNSHKINRADSLLNPKHNTTKPVLL